MPRLRSSMLVCMFAEEQADVAYQEIELVEAIGRGLAGDMVITLKNQVGRRACLRDLKAEVSVAFIVGL